MEEMNKIINTETGLKDGHNSCPNCGAPEIQFNEKYGKLYCNYCKSLFDGNELKEIENNLSNLKGNIIGSGAKDINKEFNDIITLSCGGCGAEVVIDTRTTTQARCHWCRSILSINSRIENGAVPDAILPFSIKKEDAKCAIEQFVNKRQFYALPAFKQEFTLDNVMGVYFPYMLVDANAHCTFIGKGEKLKRRYTVNKSTRYDASVYYIKRDFDITIDNLTIESSKDRLNKFQDNKTNNIINSIMPFDTENCIKFESNYLVGFTSEKRDIDINDLDVRVETQFKDVVRHSLNKDLTFYDRGVSWTKEDVHIIGKQWVAAYLPVWLYSYREIDGEQNIIHYVAVNARTKEIMGSIPINKLKLLGVSFIVEVVATVLAVFLMITFDFDEITLFIAMLSGFFYYWLIYNQYRNKNARHTYELETRNTITNMVKEDRYIKDEYGLRASRIYGVNNDKVNGDKQNIR